MAADAQNSGDALAHRPKLAAALTHAKKLKSPVIVSLCAGGRERK
jgi:hypothetical protein